MAPREIDPHDRFDDLIRAAADIYRIPWLLLKAQVWAESRFKPDAKSPAGAQGLLQLMPGTALELGVRDPFDPAQNVLAGAQYLAGLYGVFKAEKGLDRWRYALGSYNCGMGYILAAQRICKQRGLKTDRWSMIAAVLRDVIYRGRRPLWEEPVLYVEAIMDKFFDYAINHVAIESGPELEAPGPAEPKPRKPGPMGDYPTWERRGLA